MPISGSNSKREEKPAAVSIIFLIMILHNKLASQRRCALLVMMLPDAAQSGSAGFEVIVDSVLVLLLNDPADSVELTIANGYCETGQSLECLNMVCEKNFSRSH